jgi:UDP-N-acetylglucosamine pyrophosphorylase
MKDEIKEILDLLKYCVEKNEYLEVPNMKEWKPLIDYITNLQEENEKLNKILNELEKWLKENLTKDDIKNHFVVVSVIGVLEKLKELKGSEE